MESIPENWQRVLHHELQSPWWPTLQSSVDTERSKCLVFPRIGSTFRALEITPPESVKIVILGQDPYHGVGQAQGLAFSVPAGVPIPPSLRNIFIERKNDIGLDVPESGCLEPWALNGVLLLNSVLTVRSGHPNSHAGLGWENLTNAIITGIASRGVPTVFVLWGASARAKKKLIAGENIHVIESAHPSPLSAHNGFFGSAPFSRVNTFLAAQDLAAIDWSLPEGPSDSTL